MTDTAAQPATGTLHLKTGFVFLAFLLYLFKPRLEVDGTELLLSGWGESAHPLSAGVHQVTVYFPYFFMRRAGEATTAVEVAPGGATRVEYRAPWLVFSKGRMSVTPAAS